jgi:hypothetical protein
MMFPKVTGVDRKPQAVETGNSPEFRHVTGSRRRKWLKAK